jgi:hypothetical protein
MQPSYIIAGVLILGLIVGTFIYFNKPKKASFCDSAPLEYGSDYPSTCYEAPQSWVDEGKVYKGVKLGVKE